MPRTKVDFLKEITDSLRKHGFVLLGISQAKFLRMKKDLIVDLANTLRYEGLTRFLVKADRLQLFISVKAREQESGK